MNINTVYFTVEENIPIEFMYKLSTSSMRLIIEDPEDEDVLGGWASFKSVKIKSYSKSLQKACRHYQDGNKWGDYYVYQCDHHKIENLEHNGMSRQLKHKQVFSFLGKVKDLYSYEWSDIEIIDYQHSGKMENLKVAI